MMIVTDILRLPSGQQHRVAYDEPSECPICKYAIKPIALSKNSFTDDSEYGALAVTFLCQHCHKPFLAYYLYTGHVTENGHTTRQMFLAPNLFIPETFDPKIATLSPSFVEIFNQALAAESHSLDQIAGIGYRKALEFLVKDFCIFRHPGDADVIKKKTLSTVIRDYIENPGIKTLAERTAWLGNDEAHYIRKHEDRDITDMKSFIQAMVYFVGMDMIVADAESISPA